MNRYSNETEEQIAVVEYCDLMGILCVHIPNEGKRSKSYGAKLRKMGLRKGFPDLLIMEPCGKYHGLAIEMKYGKGVLADVQKMWMGALSSKGYACAVCYGFEAAKSAIDAYMRGGSAT